MERVNTRMVRWGNMKETSLGRPRHRWQHNTKMDLKEIGLVWTVMIWLRTGTIGEHLCIFGMHKMR